MINNRVYYVKLLVDSNCVSSFLEKRGCSHAQLIIVCGWNQWRLQLIDCPGTFLDKQDAVVLSQSYSHTHTKENISIM